MPPPPNPDEKSHGSGPASSEEKPYGRLLSWSFAALVCVQFLTVLNDNAYRWLVTPIGYHVLGKQYENLILTMGVVCFAVPYVILVAPAGYLGDRYSKRNVVAGCMLLQAAIIVFGMGSILIGNAVLIFTALAIMGGQGALLSPARMGVIPETVREERISAANGVMGMASVLAAVFGTVLGNGLYVLTAPTGINKWWISGSAMLAIALLGWAAGMAIDKQPAADPDREVPTRVFGQSASDLKTLSKHRNLLGAALTSAYLWFLAALAQVNVYLLATTTLDISQAKVGPLLGVLAAGVAVGSVLAGIWSGKKVDVGLTPIGAAGIAFASVVMFLTPYVAPPASWLAYLWSCGGLFLMGMSAGIYDVPLKSYLQDFSPREVRGEVLAAGNVLIFGAMLIAAGLFWVLTSILGASASIIFLLAAILTTAAMFVILHFVYDEALAALKRPFHGLGRLMNREES